MTLQTLLNQAVSLHRDGRLAEAEGLYRQVLAQAPPNFGLQYRLALLQFQQQRPAEALASVTAALAINGSAIKAYEPITRAAVERKWEFIGHGLTQSNMQHVKNEREDIIATRAEIERVTGRKPRGWLGPGLTETWETPDLLIEEGFDYVADWVLDDQPVWLKTRTKPILNVPYTQECNDVAMMLIQHHAATEYRNRAIDQFNQIYSDAADSARIMALVVHPYIMGAPHRSRYFREALEHMRAHKDVVFWTGERIHDWFVASNKPV